MLKACRNDNAEWTFELQSETQVQQREIAEAGMCTRYHAKERDSHLMRQSNLGGTTDRCREQRSSHIGMKAVFIFVKRMKESKCFQTLFSIRPEGRFHCFDLDDSMHIFKQGD